MSIRILLLEDDSLFGETVVDLLEEEGYEVTHVPNGHVALDVMFEKRFDLYLLDINVPLLDGLSLLEELRRAEDRTPTLFLTSYTEREILQKAFLSGGDDFLRKPFDNSELLLRISALLRRAYPQKIDSIGKFFHDRKCHTLFYEGEALELSKKEYALLLLLLEHVGKVVPKELIHHELWSSAESGGSDGAIRVYINRLKQLLPDVTIENLRGVGYKIVL